MLKVSHLTKVYKTKGGADVKALDDVTLEFPERGMVFLLGRSGSGKSTLLNVCGGLDSPTSGEIIVKGRSSKDFTQSDFDSYRNTFVGFVFQEYNILNEFTVEDNIALALELQGKPKDKKAVAALLEQVDLGGYARRKPNTLSGGQKQRIAIARALVKSPEIIMADEPTGALDSATGKQVLDTLKKLSAEKLVIVVSHDRDFAERYGDRIVELKDGRVISDVTKTEQKGRALSENVTDAGDALCIRSGAELSAADLEKIRAFLTESGQDAFIVRGESGVSACKKAAKITDDGGREVFTATKERPERSYAPEESKFIRSRLPARHAFKIGASGLKSKPVRLFFTILLSAVSFLMFGVLSTMMLYDKQATFRESVTDLNSPAIQLTKEYLETRTTTSGSDSTYSYSYYQSTLLTPEEVTAFGKKTGGAVGVYAPDGGSLHITNADTSKSNPYYQLQITFLVKAAEAKALPLLYGSMPEEGKNEIGISSYQADCLLFYGLADPDSETDANYLLTDRESLLGKKLEISGEIFTVSGIFGCGAVPERFAPLRPGDAGLSADEQYRLVQDLSAELEAGMYGLTVFDGQTVEQLKAASVSDRWENTLDPIVYLPFDENYFSYWTVIPQNVPTPGVTYFLEEGKTSLSQSADGRGELLVDGSIFMNIFDTVVHAKEESLSDEEAQEFRSDLYDAEYDPETGEMLRPDKYNLFFNLFYYGDYVFEGDYSDEIGVSREEMEQAPVLLREFVRRWDLSFPVVLTEHGISADICGFICTAFSPEGRWFDAQLDAATYETCREALINDGSIPEVSTDYVVPENATYNAAFVLYDGSGSMADEIFSLIDRPAPDSGVIRMEGPLQEALEQVDYLVESMSEIFLWVGLILAVFSALLLCNFISVSISYKKKEIGILRAVGARSADVFKIFFSESLIISLICILLSTVGSIVACVILNGELSALLSGISVFVFGPLSFLALAGVALLTAAIATFLPVWSAARKKPVESIRAL